MKRVRAAAGITALVLAVLVGCESARSPQAQPPKPSTIRLDPIGLDAPTCYDVPDGALVLCCGTRVRINCVPCGAYDESGIARPIDGSPVGGTVGVASERIGCADPKPAAPRGKE